MRAEVPPPQVLTQFQHLLVRNQNETLQMIISEKSKIDEFTDKIKKHTLVMNDVGGGDADETKLVEKIIKLNVGGSIFTTNLKTLLSEKDTFFSGFFSDFFLPQIQKITNEKGDEEDVYFIDRNGKNFSLILDHLRGHKIGPKIQNLTGMELFDLVEDVAFYQVRSIYSLLNEEGKELLKEHFFIELAEEAPKKKVTETKVNTRLNLTERALKEIPKEYQRTVLGETLHPLVVELDNENANKITGMLLEMDTYMILKWIEDDKELRKIVAEAVSVLKGASLYN